MSQPPPLDGKRVFLTGVFDMQNYGDLLFPLIARRRLAEIGAEIAPIAPTSVFPGLQDAIAPSDISEMLSGDSSVDAIVIGGGYLIHTHRMDVLREYQDANVGEWAGPGLWLGAALAAALRDIPLAWNAPGVPHPIPPSQRRLADAALRASSYVSVRDRGGAELLGAPAEVPVVVAPDPIAELARLWTLRDLEAPFRNLLERKNAGGESDFVAIHFRNRSLAGLPPPEAAVMLKDFSLRTRLKPIIVAVGRTHDDDVLARAISAGLDAPHILLDDPASLREIASAIAYSRMYIGASLHGYVTALAYGAPAILVAKPAYKKFSGFLEHVGRMEDMALDWESAYAAAAARKGEPRMERIPQTVFAALDEHWRRIKSAIESREDGAAGRRAFLSEMLAFGLRELGPEWAMRPVTRRAPRFVPLKQRESAPGSGAAEAEVRPNGI